MRILAIDIFSLLVIFFGLMLPLFGWLWIAFCKYVRHFHIGCNSCRCWYHCKKCLPLHSEQLEVRIALLEKKYSPDSVYIIMLRRQLQMYLDNAVLDRETESEMIHRIVREVRERSG